MSQSIPEDLGQWWVEVDQKPTGPYTTGYVAAALRSGVMQAHQHLCPAGGREWRVARQWPQLAAHCVEPSAPSGLHVEGQTAIGNLLTPSQIVRVLTFYALVINPIIWLANSTIEFSSPSTLPPGTEAYRLESLWKVLGVVANAVIAGGWLATGFFLNRFDRRAVWVALATYLGSWMLYGLLIWALFAISEMMGDVEIPAATALENFISLLSSLVGAVEMVFLTLMTILLIAKRQAIPWNTPGQPS